MTAAPRSSMPRLPARPVSCWYSFGVSRRISWPSNLLRLPTTTERAGMLMPSASVSVAKTARSSPRANSVSTSTLRPGSKPAWWKAQPARQQIGWDAHLLQVAIVFRQMFETDPNLLANKLLLLRRGKEMAGCPRCRLLDDATSGQEVERGQQIGVAQDGEYLARLRRPALLRTVDPRPALSLRNFCTFRCALRRLCRFGVFSRSSPGPSGSFPAFARLAPVLVFPQFLLFLTLKSVDSIAAHHLRQPSLAAHVREAFHALALRILHKMQLIIKEVIMIERHSSLLMHHQLNRRVDTADPLGKVWRVADSGGEANKLDVSGRADDGLFPDGAALNIAKVVQFVENDKADIGQFGWDITGIFELLHPALFQQHIAIDFGGHDDNRRAAALDNIARHQADGLVAIQVAQVAILLIGERLERRGIDDALAALLRQPDREFGHQRLARPGRRGHQHRLPVRQNFHSIQLKWVKGKRIARHKLRDPRLNLVLYLCVFTHHSSHQI